MTSSGPDPSSSKASSKWGRKGPTKITMAGERAEEPLPGRRTWLGLLVLVLVVAGVVVAFVASRGDKEEQTKEIKPAAIGDQIRSFQLIDGADIPFEELAVGHQKATVVWFWSTQCPCVRDSEARIRELLERYGKRGVHLIVVDSDRRDTAEAILAYRQSKESPYEVYRDQKKATARKLGVTRAGMVAILDNRGVLRYRGPMDDHPAAPKVSYAYMALDAILSGAKVNPSDVEGYGLVYPD